jgi:dihydrofolate reductase
MSRLIVFNQISLDGYFSGPNGDIDWAHKTGKDPEWEGFVAENAGGGGVLLFGRITYQLMESYWPTPQAKHDDPRIAQAMNNLQKVVFSRTLDFVSWTNTRLVKSDPAAEVRKLKQEPGQDLVILGSGSIVARLTQERLIDEYQFIVNPVVLGKGRTMFEGLTDRMDLMRTKTRPFKNGNMVLCYEPVK